MFLRSRYFIDFRCGIMIYADFFCRITVFVDIFCGIAVFGTPQCPPHYFLYKGVASEEEASHTIYIYRARAGATKTLGLAAME